MEGPEADIGTLSASTKHTTLEIRELSRWRAAFIGAGAGAGEVEFGLGGRGVGLGPDLLEACATCAACGRPAMRATRLR